MYVPLTRRHKPIYGGSAAAILAADTRETSNIFSIIEKVEDSGIQVFYFFFPETHIFEKDQPKGLSPS